MVILDLKIFQSNKIDQLVLSFFILSIHPEAYLGP